VRLAFVKDPADFLAGVRAIGVPALVCACSVGFFIVSRSGLSFVAGIGFSPLFGTFPLAISCSSTRNAKAV
jgi:hypothetical protein